MLEERRINFLHLLLLPLIIWLRAGRAQFCPDIVHGYNCDFQNNTLYLHCEIPGNSHFINLGGFDALFSRKCRYVLVELCDENPLGFKILANFANHPANIGQSVVAAVSLELAGATYEVRLDGNLRVNGVATMKPYGEDSNGVFVAEISPDMTNIIRVSDDVNDLIRIAYNYKLYRIDVHLKISLFSDLICGLCADKAKMKDDLDSERIRPPLYNCDVSLLKP